MFIEITLFGQQGDKVRHNINYIYSYKSVTQDESDGTLVELVRGAFNPKIRVEESPSKIDRLIKEARE